MNIARMSALKDRTFRTNSGSVILGILTSAQEAQPRTIIMYGARLSYAQLSRHMKYLENKRMIQKTNDGKRIITDVGRDYLEH